MKDKKNKRIVGQCGSCHKEWVLVNQIGICERCDKDMSGTFKLINDKLKENLVQSSLEGLAEGLKMVEHDTKNLCEPMLSAYKERVVIKLAELFTNPETEPGYWFNQALKKAIQIIKETK